MMLDKSLHHQHHDQQNDDECENPYGPTSRGYIYIYMNERTQKAIHNFRDWCCHLVKTNRA
jgi:hypothetical protein